MINLEQEEYIVKEVRKHWLFIAIEIASSIFLGLIPFAIVISFLAIETTPAIYTLRLYTIAIIPLWILGAWISFFYFWTDYYLDTLIITNKRIFNIEQKGMFHRIISSFPLSRIQDVTVELPGILSTFLRFGTITIETAGENHGFTLHNATNPEEAKRIINEVQNKNTKPSETLTNTTP